MEFRRVRHLVAEPDRHRHLRHHRGAAAPDQRPVEQRDPRAGVVRRDRRRHAGRARADDGDVGFEVYAFWRAHDRNLQAMGIRTLYFRPVWGGFMIGFELAEPRTLAEAMRLLDPADPSVRPISGGTAVMLMLKSGLYRPTRLVSLRRIEDRYRRIEAAADGTLHIGAMTPLAALERSEVVARHAPVIVRTMRTLSNVRVRNQATVGGHLAHADPHMDLPPVLAALGASVTIAAPRGERTVPVEALYSGYLQTVLANDELIVALTIPPQGGARAAYAKVTARSADDWPSVGIAVSLGGPNGPRAYVGAATEVPTRLKAAEAVLAAATDAAGLRRAGEEAADEADPIADQHGSAAYKRQLIRVHLARAVHAALNGGA